MTDKQYISQEKKGDLEQELENLKCVKSLEIAKRIDEARQMGDLSENAEYHQAREDLAWAQSRIKQIDRILDNFEIISSSGTSDTVEIGSTAFVEIAGTKKEFCIVGPEEADPLSGKISNESPLGEAFLGKRKGDKVEVEVPAGTQVYTVLQVK